MHLSYKLITIIYIYYYYKWSLSKYNIDGLDFSLIFINLKPKGLARHI